MAINHRFLEQEALPNILFAALIKRLFWLGARVAPAPEQPAADRHY